MFMVYEGRQIKRGDVKILNVSYTFGQDFFFVKNRLFTRHFRRPVRRRHQSSHGGIHARSTRSIIETVQATLIEMIVPIRLVRHEILNNR